MKDVKDRVCESGWSRVRTAVVVYDKQYVDWYEIWQARSGRAMKKEVA